MNLPKNVFAEMSWAGPGRELLLPAPMEPIVLSQGPARMWWEGAEVNQSSLA